MNRHNPRTTRASVRHIGRPAIDLVATTRALVVAEHLSFRRAAAALGIQQSAVSRSVRSLEDTLGVSLFERYHGGVRITAAGTHFLDQVRRALRQLDYAVKTADAAGRGVNGRLSIGILPSSGPGFLRELLRAYLTDHPEVAIQFAEGTTGEHIARIRKRRLDVAFVTGIPVVPSCEVTQFWTERLFVALPQGHALCARDDINWEILRNERFILRQSDPGPQIHDYVIARLADLGQAARVERLDVGRGTLMYLVGLGLGLSFATEAATAISFSGGGVSADRGGCGEHAVQRRYG